MAASSRVRNVKSTEEDRHASRHHRIHPAAQLRQLHDVDNVFVIDGSVHVNNGGFNPVLTIMAIAYYASASLVCNWKGTAFR